MHDDTRALETAAWTAADGNASEDQLALLEADPRAWRITLERLLDETEDNLDSVRQLPGPERDQAQPTRLTRVRSNVVRCANPSRS